MENSITFNVVFLSKPSLRSPQRKMLTNKMFLYNINASAIELKLNSVSS